MFIQTQETPNPETMKFLPGVEVLKKGTMSFSEEDNLSQAPLAESIFKSEGVKGVFFGQDFITVTKSPDKSWEHMRPIVMAAIMDHFVAGYPVVLEASNTNKSTEGTDPITAQIEELIETRVRPAVAEDGGDIIFKDFKDGIVYLELHGACSGCPSSTITLKSGIENMLKHYIPEVEAVEAV